MKNVKRCNIEFHYKNNSNFELLHFTQYFTPHEVLHLPDNYCIVPYIMRKRE